MTFQIVCLCIQIPCLLGVCYFSWRTHKLNKETAAIIADTQRIQAATRRKQAEHRQWMLEQSLEKSHA